MGLAWDWVWQEIEPCVILGLAKAWAKSIFGWRLCERFSLEDDWADNKLGLRNTRRSGSSSHWIWENIEPCVRLVLADIWFCLSRDCFVKRFYPVGDGVWPPWMPVPASGPVSSPGGWRQLAGIGHHNDLLAYCPKIICYGWSGCNGTHYAVCTDFSAHTLDLACSNCASLRSCLLNVQTSKLCRTFYTGWELGANKE